MRIHQELLRKRVLAYLSSPAANDLWDIIGCSLLMGLFFSCFSLCLGLVMLPTIVWTWPGLKSLWNGLTFNDYRSDKANQLRKNPADLYPIITHSIIIGPQGFGLVAGSFDPDVERTIGRLAKLAIQFGELYRHGPTDPADNELFALLRDDQFKQERRRKVPSQYAGDLEIYLFDVWIDLAKTFDVSPASPLVACIATKGDEGIIGQIPWDVVAPAIEP